jgi:hypothetical protein
MELAFPHDINGLTKAHTGFSEKANTSMISMGCISKNGALGVGGPRYGL